MKSVPFIAAKATWLFIACLAGISAQAGTIGISYSFAGVGVGPPVQSGTNLLQNNFATGSVVSGVPALNTAWNPVTYTNHCVIDLTTGLLNGTINFAFADGSTLFGNEFENVTALVATGGIGPFTGTYTFTGGTGKFAGATGSASIVGVATATGSTESGSGTITGAGVSAAPEPASVALIFGGLVVMVAKRRLVR